MIVIENPYGLKVRPERQAAEALAASRSQIKKMMDNDRIFWKQKGKNMQNSTVYLPNSTGLL